MRPHDPHWSVEQLRVALNLPAVQATHASPGDVVEAVGFDVPAGHHAHDVHSACPSMLLYEPEAHAVHAA
jgi:hypothetical protein